MSIIYRWTGEYRPPKKGEWFLEINPGLVHPMKAMVDEKVECWILDRQETKKEYNPFDENNF